MLKRLVRRVIYVVPGAQAVWVRMNGLLGRGPRREFSGWGMVTEAQPPWHDGGGDVLAKDFLKAHAEVDARVGTGAFTLSQFNDVQNKAWKLRQLMWRHYVVFWSARYASGAAGPQVANLVECGVCDGLTAYFAMRAVQGGHRPFRAFLYDAWEGMKAEYLLESEQTAPGSYSYLSLENTKRNLAPFDGTTVFVKGFIPESFDTAEQPPSVVWLHIDLNSSLPTAAALRALFDRVVPGGVILFDDYGWGDYQETKHAADQFLAGKPGVLLPLPTGQAMFFKR